MDNIFNNVFETNSIDNGINNTIDNSINNSIESLNDISMDSIENELNNINISYVNDENDIVETPSAVEDNSIDLITPQPEESKNLFDIEPSFETKIEEPTFSTIETPVVEDISIPEINTSAFENPTDVEIKDSFTFDDNAIISTPSVMESVDAIEKTPVAEDTPITEEAEITNSVIDEKLKRVIENVNNMNINYAKIKSILENAKVNGIADSEYLKATFEKMAVFDEIMNKFNDKASKYINNRIKGEKEEKDTNLDNMVFMDNKVEEAA